MADKTGIQWTDATWNPTIGCQRVSEGCRNCYAETQAARIVAMSRARGDQSPYEDVVKMDICALCGGDGEDRYAAIAGVARPCDECDGIGLMPRPLWNGRAIFLAERLDQPLRWTKPRMVFVNSMSDLFHEDLSFPQVASVFGVMAASPTHTFQVLTKRPGRAVEFFEWLHEESLRQRDIACAPNRVTTMIDHAHETFAHDVPGDHSSTFAALNAAWRKARDPGDDHPDVWPISNVWLGVSAEDQKTADERIPLLLQCPTAVRFVSAEPLIGPIRFSEAMLHGKFYQCLGAMAFVEGRAEVDPCDGCMGYSLPGGDWCGAERGASLDWVIVGGESGPGARGCGVEWVRELVEQCGDAGVACFVKQLGAQPMVPLAPEEYGPTYSDGKFLSPQESYDQHSTKSLHRQMKLDSRKGGDWSEWPADLRVRQYPEVADDC